LFNLLATQRETHSAVNPGCQPGDAAPWGHARENHLVPEERTPFVGGGVVVRDSADEFDLAVWLYDNKRNMLETLPTL
jgi:hypothetical protein